MEIIISLVSVVPLIEAIQFSRGDSSKWKLFLLMKTIPFSGSDSL